MTILGANEAVIDQLVKYIKDNIPEINNTYLEWPNHNEPLEMPCVCVLTSGNAGYTNQMPILWKREAGLSYYIVGNYDYTISIDLWAEYKQTRGDLMEKIFDLFNKQFIEENRALGANLTLEEYYNVIAGYELNGYNYVDSEQGSQRDEWRAKLSVIVNFPRILSRVESEMEDIELHNEISENADTDTIEIKPI